MKKAGSIFSLIVGISILILWTILLFSGQVKELTEEPFRITAHLFSEGLTALLLIWGGILSLRNHQKGEAIQLVSFGMLSYSTLTAGGYYLQLGNFLLTGLFLILSLLTGVFLVTNIQKKK